MSQPKIKYIARSKKKYKTEKKAWESITKTRTLKKSEVTPAHTKKKWRWELSIKKLIKKEIKHYKKKNPGDKTFDQVIRIAYEKFRNNPQKIYDMPSNPKIKINDRMLSIGYCIAIAYIRLEDGKIESYMHEFGDKVILLYMKDTNTLLINDLKKKLKFNPTNLIHDGQKLTG